MLELRFLHAIRKHGDVVSAIRVQGVLRFVDDVRRAGGHDDARDLEERRDAVQADRADVRAARMRGVGTVFSGCTNASMPFSYITRASASRAM